MKKLIRLTALIMLIAISALTLSSCSGTPYDYELEEHITVADYTQIVIDEEKITELVEKYKDDLIAAHSIKSDTPILDRPLQKGDIAVVTYNCYVNSGFTTNEEPSTPPVLQDEECEIVLGRGKYPEDLEKALMNKDVPSSHIFPVSIPSNFGLSKLAGNNTTFYVSIITAYELVKPEYSDEFVAQHTGYSTMEEYEAALRIEARYQLIWDALLEQSEMITYPQKELSEHKRDFIEYYTTQATASSLTLEQYVERKFFIELTEFSQKAADYSKKLTKEEVLVYHLARQYELEPTDEEYLEKATAYAQKHGYSSLSDYESIFGKNLIKYSIMLDTVKQYVAQRSPSGTEPQLPPESTESEG